MAELLGDAVIKITVDATGAKQGLDAAEAKTKATVSSMENAMARLRGSMSRISESLKMPAISTVGTDALTRSIDQINAKAAATKQRIKDIYAEQLKLVELSKSSKYIDLETKAGRAIPAFDEAAMLKAEKSALARAENQRRRDVEYVETQGKKAAEALERSLQDEMHRKTKHQSQLDALREKELSKEVASKERIADVRSRLSRGMDATQERLELRSGELVRQANEITVKGVVEGQQKILTTTQQAYSKKAQLDSDDLARTRKYSAEVIATEKQRGVEISVQLTKQDQIRRMFADREAKVGYDPSKKASEMERGFQKISNAQIAATQASINAERKSNQESAGFYQQRDVLQRKILDSQEKIAQSAKTTGEASKKGFNEAAKGADSFNKTLERLQRTFLAFVAMWVLTKVVSGLRDLVAGGLAFNRTMEDSKLGIGTLFVATQNFTDIAGKALQGERLWSAAMKESGEVQTQLQMANLKTAATYEQLMRAYQMALPLGTAGGFNKEEVLNFSTAVVQAATAMMIPLDQLGEEIRSVLSGSMTDMHTRLKPLLTAMGIGNKEIKEAIKQGRLYEVVMKALSPAIQGADLAMNTFSTRLSNLKDAFSQVLGAAFKGSFDALKQSFLDITNSLVQIKEVGGKMTFKLNEGAVASFRLLDSAVKSVVVNLTKAGVAMDKFREQHPVLMGFITLFGSWILQIGLAIASVQLLSKVGKLLFMSFEWIFKGGLVAAFTKMLGPIAAAIGLWGTLAIAIAAVGVAIFALNWDEWILKQKVAGVALSEWLESLKLSMNVAWEYIKYGFAEAWVQIEKDFPTFTSVIDSVLTSFRQFWEVFKSDAAKAIGWVKALLRDMGKAASSSAGAMDAGIGMPGGIAREPGRGVTGYGTWHEAVTTSGSAEGSPLTDAYLAQRAIEVAAVITTERFTEKAAVALGNEMEIADARKDLENAEISRRIAADAEQQERMAALSSAVSALENRINNITVTRPAQRVGYPTKPEDAWKTLPTTPVPYESAGGKYMREVNEESQRGPTKDAMYQVAPRRKTPDPDKKKGPGPVGASDINQFLDQMEKKTITMYRELGDANYEFWINVKKDAGDSLGAAELEISKWAEHQRSEIWQQVQDSDNKIREIEEKLKTSRGKTDAAQAELDKAKAERDKQWGTAFGKSARVDAEEIRRYHQEISKAILQEAVDVAQLKVSYEELTGTTETLAIAQMKLIELQAQLNKVGKSPAQQELIAKNANVEATKKQIEASGTFLEGMSVGYMEWKSTMTTAGQAGKQVFEALAEAMNGAADALTEFTMTGKMTFSDFANSMIRDMMRMMYQMALMQMFKSAFGGVLENIFGGASASTASMGSIDTTIASMQSYNVAGSAPAFSWHSGGTAGITPANLHQLPRFHSGLSSDEYPAILQRGETILPKGYHDKSSSKSGPEVQVIINNKTGKDIKHKETEPRFDGKRWVKEVVLELQQTDPSFRNQMRS